MHWFSSSKSPPNSGIAFLLHLCTQLQSKKLVFKIHFHTDLTFGNCLLITFIFCQHKKHLPFVSQRLLIELHYKYISSILTNYKRNHCLIKRMWPLAFFKLILLKLEDTTCYAGLLLAPAEAKAFFALRVKIERIITLVTFRNKLSNFKGIPKRKEKEKKKNHKIPQKKSKISPLQKKQAKIQGFFLNAKNPLKTPKIQNFSK